MVGGMLGLVLGALAEPAMAVTLTQRGAPWGLARISHKEPLSFRTFNKYIFDEHAGEGVDVYVVDSGVNTAHNDFEGRARWGVNLSGDGRDEDCNGRGSHMAGTVAGKRYGVAKKAQLIAVKVASCGGTAKADDVAAGIEWAARSAQEAKRPSVAVLGVVGSSARLREAINAAVDSGLLVVDPAGNDDQDACDLVAAEKAVTVGASTINDERAGFSNWGRCVDVFAAGKDVTSVWRGSALASNTISGTAMAAAHGAGVAAYLLYLDAALTPVELKQRMLSLSSRNMLADVPSQTPNLLLFVDPPS